MKISPTDLILNPDGSVYHLGLMPENISDTIITVGDPDRVEKVSWYFDNVEFRKGRREFITHTGTLKGKRLSVISTGIGTDNVEIFFHEIDALVNIDLKTREPRSAKKKLEIIRIGTSGALQGDIPLDSHLVSDFALGFDNLMTFYNLPMDDFGSSLSEGMEKATGVKPYVAKGSATLRERIGAGMLTGHTATCPGFYAPQGRQLRIPVRFPNFLENMRDFRSGDFRISNFEMETAGYYALAKLLGHDVVSVNALIANRATREFSKKPDVVIDDLIRKVLERVT